MKNFKTHYARKVRQLRYFSKQLSRLQNSGQFAAFSTKKQQQLRARLRRMTNNLIGCVSGSRLRKTLAGAAILLGLGFANGAQAQVNFAPSVNNPFNLTNPNDINFINFADMDADGDLDIMTSTYGGGEEYYNLKFYENIGTDIAPDFASPVSEPFGIASNPEENIGNPVIADFDNDGDMDIMTGLFLYGGLHFYENVSTDPNTPEFAPPVADPFGIIANTPLIFLTGGDLDGDGDIDLMEGDYSGNIAFRENIGTPELPDFAPPVTSPFNISPSNDIHLLTMSDIDGDGDLDVYEQVYSLTNYDFQYVFHENIGTPTAPDFAAPVADAFGIMLKDGAPHYPAFADLDGDGDEDLMLGAYYGGEFFYFENLGLDINTAPTSNDASLLGMQDMSYAFTGTEFSFADAEEDLFAGVQIASLPALGTLELDGTAVTIDQTIMPTDLTLLTFTPNASEFGMPYTDFEFRVFDGELYSENYVMTVDIEMTNGTSSPVLQAAIQLSPNPAKEQLNVAIQLSENANNLQWTVYNTLGMKLLAGQTAQQNLSINIVDLPSGTYFLRLEVDGKMKSERFVKA